MSKAKFRNITINNECYLWKCEHIHVTDYVLSKCAEKVVIYLKDYKKSPLQLLFKEDEPANYKANIVKWHVGYPEDGVIWHCPTKIKASLNTIDFKNTSTTIIYLQL